MGTITLVLGFVSRLNPALILGVKASRQSKMEDWNCVGRQPAIIYNLFYQLYRENINLFWLLDLEPPKDMDLALVRSCGWKDNKFPLLFEPLTSHRELPSPFNGSVPSAKQCKNKLYKKTKTWNRIWYAQNYYYFYAMCKNSNWNIFTGISTK